MRFLSSLPLKIQLLSVFILLGILSTGIIAGESILIGTEALHEKSSLMLTSIKESKAQEIENYFHQIEHQVLTYSENKMIVHAMRDFSTSFYALEDQLTGQNASLWESNIKGYYENGFLKQLTANTGKNESFDPYYPGGNIALYLQNLYIAENPNPLGEKDALNAANDTSAYSMHHATYHPVIRSFLQKFGYYDIFLVDDETGDIVYSVFKEVDYATNLLSGPYSGTNFADVFKSARIAIDKDHVSFEDFKEYTPSYAAPASFIASPIFDGDERIGVLVFQMPVDKINDVMTGGQNWQKNGLGETGETYLVAVEDKKMRSIARGVAEDPAAYIQSLTEAGVDRSEIQKIELYETSLLYKTVDTVPVQEASAGHTGVMSSENVLGEKVLSSYRPVNILGKKWVIVSEFDEAEVFASSQKLARMTVVSGAVILAVLIVIALWFTRSLTIPIGRLKEAAGLVAQGDTEVTVEMRRKDELGQLGKSFNAMVEGIREGNRQVREEKDKVERAVREAEQAKSSAQDYNEYLSLKVDTILREMEKFAEGDLTVHLDIEREDEIGKLYDGFNRAVSQVHLMIEQMSEAVTTTSSSATQINVASESLASGAQEQSYQATEVAAAVEEMSSTIMENAKLATSTSDLTNQCGQAAEKGGDVVSKTIDKMQQIADVVQLSAGIIERLGDSSQQIGEIISVINEIADQTNLLALNAAIEAARAGEQGKGFAVVADEVRKLAERTTDSTQQIAEMIKSIQAETEQAVVAMKNGRERVDEGLGLADSAGGALEEIVSNIHSVVDLVTQIATATEEQAQTSTSISQNVVKISDLSSESAQGITEISGSAHQLNTMTAELNELVSQFKLSNSSTRQESGPTFQDYETDYSHSAY